MNNSWVILRKWTFCKVSKLNSRRTTKFHTVSAWHLVVPDKGSVQVSRSAPALPLRALPRGQGDHMSWQQRYFTISILSTNYINNAEVTVLFKATSVKVGNQLFWCQWVLLKALIMKHSNTNPNHMLIVQSVEQSGRINRGVSQISLRERWMSYSTSSSTHHLPTVFNNSSTSSKQHFAGLKMGHDQHCQYRDTPQ